MEAPEDDRRQRRLIMTPAVMLGVPVLLVCLPVLAVLTLVADLLTGPRRLRFSRLLAMGSHYVVCEWFGLVAAFVLWVLTGFGLLMQRPWSRRMHAAVQRRWAAAIFAGAKWWMGARVEIDDGDLRVDGPMIIAARHASFIDALVPSVVLGRVSTRPNRHVMKRELAWDPCLDVFGHRHPNHFVTRGGAGRRSELEAIERLAATAGGEPLVIFPEGTFRTAKRAERVMEKFATREPTRAARLDLRHMLPARPGGLQALMRGRPDADLVFIAHTGFELFWSFRAFFANVPFREPVRIKVWRVPVAEFGDDIDGRLRVIDEWWQRMDYWIEATLGRPASTS